MVAHKNIFLNNVCVCVFNFIILESHDKIKHDKNHVEK